MKPKSKGLYASKMKSHTSVLLENFMLH